MGDIPYDEYALRTCRMFFEACFNSEEESWRPIPRQFIIEFLDHHVLLKDPVIYQYVESCFQTGNSTELRTFFEEMKDVHLEFFHHAFHNVKLPLETLEFAKSTLPPGPKMDRLRSNIDFAILSISMNPEPALDSAEQETNMLATTDSPTTIHDQIDPFAYFPKERYGAMEYLMKALAPLHHRVDLSKAQDFRMTKDNWEVYMKQLYLEAYAGLHSIEAFITDISQRDSSMLATFRLKREVYKWYRDLEQFLEARKLGAEVLRKNNEGNKKPTTQTMAQIGRDLEADNPNSLIDNMLGLESDETFQHYLNWLDPKKATIITIDECLKCFSQRDGEFVISTLTKNIGAALEMEYKAQMVFHIAVSAKIPAYQTSVKGARDLNTRARRLVGLATYKGLEDIPSMEWPVHIRASMGRYLLHCFLKVAKLEVPKDFDVGREYIVKSSKAENSWAEKNSVIQMLKQKSMEKMASDQKGGRLDSKKKRLADIQLAKTTHLRAIKRPSKEMYTCYAFLPGKPVRESKATYHRVEPHPYLYNLLLTDVIATQSILRMLPMLLPPRSWITDNSGGYVLYRHDSVRMTECRTGRIHIKEAAKMGRMHGLYTALDILGRLAWTVNSEVLHVVLEAWREQDLLPGVPDRSMKEPEILPKNGLFGAEYFKMLKGIHKTKRENANMYSRNCAAAYTLVIAAAFKNKKFYLPHNMDFRGRAYPLPAHLHHLGDDMSRGLMRFYEKKPLGPNGVTWIKIHIANLFGHNKITFEERVAFVDENIAEMIDSAEDPLKGRRWWTTSENPWQTLSACMELAAALRCPDPSQYLSNLPVHQDGTYNGLQHYAALGGDSDGAQQVNLSPSDKPNDVYSAVCQQAVKQIELDAEEGIPEALAVRDKVTRKVIKQTVMTHVYGVTLLEPVNRSKLDLQNVLVSWTASTI